MKSKISLCTALAALLFAGAMVAVCQADRAAMDYRAETVVAHQVIESPSGSVTGSWSPLFSCLMVPLVSCGADDQTAARLILIATGMLYVWATRQVAISFIPPGASMHRSTIRFLTVCAAIQAIRFATHLLDPDLLASGILFCCFVLMRSRDDVGRSNPVAWAALVAAIFCSRYFVVNLNAWEIVPVIVPLSCLGTSILVRNAIQESARSTMGSLDF